MRAGEIGRASMRGVIAVASAREKGMKLGQRSPTRRSSQRITDLRVDAIDRSAVRGSSDVNYLVLLLVIILGVTAGNLLSAWIGAQVASYFGKQAMAEFSKSLRGAPGRAEESSTTGFPMPGELIQKQQEKAREQRRRDRDGVRLAQACEEWRRADSQLKTETTNAEARKHCGLYERYVKDGILPGKR